MNFTNFHLKKNLTVITVFCGSVSKFVSRSEIQIFFLQNRSLMTEQDEHGQKRKGHILCSILRTF